MHYNGDGKYPMQFRGVQRAEGTNYMPLSERQMDRVRKARVGLGPVTFSCDGKPVEVVQQIKSGAAPALLAALELAEATINRLHRHAPGSAQGTLDVIHAAIAAVEKEAV